MILKSSEIIYFFDIDDTLFTSKIIIPVVSKKTGKVISDKLTSKNYLNYKLKDNEDFDYSYCRSSIMFKNTCKPIQKNIDFLNKIYKNSNSKIILLTARASFDNTGMFLATLYSYNIPINDTNRIEVEYAGNYSKYNPNILLPTYKRKCNLINKYILTNKYKKFFMIDDIIDNISEFLEFPIMNKELSKYKFIGLLSDSDGNLKSINVPQKRKDDVKMLQNVIKGSTMIDTVRYYEKSQKMGIIFRNTPNREYVYENVSEELHGNFLGASSKGKFFNDHIYVMPHTIKFSLEPLED